MKNPLSSLNDQIPVEFPDHDVIWKPEDCAERLRMVVKRAGGNAVVAKKSGVPLGTLNDYLKRGDMKVSNALSIAQACGVDVGWLITGEADAATINATAVPEPQKTAAERTVKAFATIKVDTMARALEMAKKTFSDAGAVPEPRELVQVMLLLYDGMNNP